MVRRQTGDLESRSDEAYLEGLAQRLRVDLAGQGVLSIDAVLGFGEVARQIVRISHEKSRST